MILNDLKVTDYVTYKHATLPLNYQGQTVIRGRNQNVGAEGNNAAAASNTNGAGKSILVNALAKVLINRNARQRIALEDAKISVGVDQYVVAVTKKGYSVNSVVDGAMLDVTAKGIDAAGRQIDALFPLSPLEFYSTVHLDSRRTSVIQMGTSAERLAWLTQIFHLDGYDEIKTALNAETRGLTADQTRHETLTSLLSERKASLLPKSERKAMTTRLMVAKDRLNQLTAGLRKASVVAERKRALKFLMTSRTKLLETSKRLAVSTKAADIDRELETTDETLTYLAVLQEWETLGRAVEKARGTLSQVLPPDCQSNRIEGVKKQIAGLTVAATVRRELVAMIKQQLARVGSSTDKPLVWLKDFQNLLNTHLATPCPTEYDEEAHDEVQHLRHALTRQLKWLRGTEDTCGTCGTHVPKEHRDKQVRSVEKELARLSHQLEAYEAQSSALHDWKTLDKELAELQKSATTLKHLVDKLQQVPKTDPELQAQLENYVKAHADLDRLTRQYETTDKPEPSPHVQALLSQSQDASIKDVQRMVKKRELELTAYTRDCSGYRALHKSFVSAHGEPRTVQSEDLDTDTDLSKIETEIAEIHKMLPAVQSRLLSHQQSEEQVGELEADIREIETRLTDLPALTALKSAYANSGLKSVAMRGLVARIAQNMNRFASLLFPEDFQFEWSIDAKRCDIMVHRTPAKKLTGKARKKTNSPTRLSSDVSELSGAESRAFTLLLTLSILPLIPANRRTNIIILDEMTANMDAARKSLFINDFLPMLNRVIPHVIIVTPEDDLYPNAREFVSVKSGNRTQLLKGDA